MPRPRGLMINWSALGVIATLVGAIISFVWLAATQNAAIATNHTIESTAITANQTSIAQLQANEKENDKQRVEVLLHLQSIDQTLKDWSYGSPRGVPTQAPIGTTIIQQAPAAVDGNKQSMPRE
jgi:hypothetical protein